MQMSCKIEKLSDAPGAYLNAIISMTNIFSGKLSTTKEELEQHYECTNRVLEIGKFSFFLLLVYVLKRIFIDGESAKKILFWQKRRR